MISVFEAIQQELTVRYGCKWASPTFVPPFNSKLYLQCDELCINLNRDLLLRVLWTKGATVQQFDLNNPQSIIELHKWLDKRYSEPLVASPAEIYKTMVKFKIYG